MKITRKFAFQELEKAIASIQLARREFASKDYKETRALLYDAFNHLNRGQIFTELSIEKEEKVSSDLELQGWTLLDDPDDVDSDTAYLITTTGTSISYRVAYCVEGKWYDWNTDEPLEFEEDETLYFKEV